jgi:hypothetical protein
MKNQLNQSSVKMTKKFDQQLYDMLVSDLKNTKNAKPSAIRSLNVPDGLMVA